MDGKEGEEYERLASLIIKEELEIVKPAFNPICNPEETPEFSVISHVNHQ